MLVKVSDPIAWEAARVMSHEAMLQIARRSAETQSHQRTSNQPAAMAIIRSAFVMLFAIMLLQSANCRELQDPHARSMLATSELFFLRMLLTSAPFKFWLDAGP